MQAITSHCRDAPVCFWFVVKPANLIAEPKLDEEVTWLVRSFCTTLCVPGSMLEQLLMHAYAALLAPHSACVVFRCALPAFPLSVTRKHTHVKMTLARGRGSGLQHGTWDHRLENHLLICCPADIMQHDSKEAWLGDKGLLFFIWLSSSWHPNSP